jgi:hypothetical protein
MGLGMSLERLGDFELALCELWAAQEGFARAGDLAAEKRMRDLIALICGAAGISPCVNRCQGPK